MVENKTWYVGAWSSKVAIVLLVFCPKAEAEVDKNVELKCGEYFITTAVPMQWYRIYFIMKVLVSQSSTVPCYIYICIYIDGSALECPKSTVQDRISDYLLGPSCR